MRAADLLVKEIDAPAPGSDLGWRPARRIRVRPLMLQAGGLLAEAAVIAALGYLVMATGLVNVALPEPAFVAVGYMALVLVQNGVAAPPCSAKVGSAIRVLALAFICLAMVAASSRP